jgi:prephenate dehydrogenase
MTRVAMGSPDVWLDICTENREAIAEGLGRLIIILEAWRDRVADGDAASIRQVFEQARDCRMAFQSVATPENRSNGDASS